VSLNREETIILLAIPRTMLHDSPIGLDDNVHAVIGDTDSDGIFHGVLLTNDEEVVVGAIHAHVFD
jgi:hypothetical protein